MPYITSIERLAKQEGLRDGLLESIEVALDTNFGAAGKKLLKEIRAIEDVAKLRKIFRTIIKAKDTDDVFRLLHR